MVCKLLKENLDKMPGDLRTQIGFVTFDSTVHFYSLKVSNSVLKQHTFCLVIGIQEFLIGGPRVLPKMRCTV